MGDGENFCWPKKHDSCLPSTGGDCKVTHPTRMMGFGQQIIAGTKIDQSSPSHLSLRGAGLMQSLATCPPEFERDLFVTAAIVYRQKERDCGARNRCGVEASRANR